MYHFLSRNNHFRLLPRHPRSNSTGLLDEAGSRTDVVADTLQTATGSINPDGLDVGNIAPSAPSSEDPMNPSLLGTERPESEFGVTPSFHLVVDKMMADWERATGGVVDQLPIIDESAVTLDQAMVWPSPDSAAHAGGATGAGDENQVYGGGQIIGLNGDVILSACPMSEYSRGVCLARSHPKTIAEDAHFDRCGYAGINRVLRRVSISS